LSRQWVVSRRRNYRSVVVFSDHERMPRDMHWHVREAFLVAAWGLWACCSGCEPASAKPVEHHAVSASDSPTQGAVNATAPAAAAVSPDGATEWDKVNLEDEGPLCVFADHIERGNALFLQDVREQTLSADSTVVFGTFAPGCQNEVCDSPPTLQCWVDGEEPNTLVVHSRLFFEHKRGTVCTKDCHPVLAGCETGVLKAGTYTVKYGGRTFGLRVPSVIRDPCFTRE
jgi:hypothetical protein